MRLLNFATLVLAMLFMLFMATATTAETNIDFGDVAFNSTATVTLDSADTETSDNMELVRNYWRDGLQPTEMTLAPVITETNDSTYVIFKVSYSMDGTNWTTATALDTMTAEGTGWISFVPEPAKYLKFPLESKMAGGDTVTVEIPYSICW